MTTRTRILPPQHLEANYRALLSDDTPPLARLSALRSVEVNLESYRHALVMAARAAGASWSMIAVSLGVSKQAVHAKYGTGFPLED